MRLSDIENAMRLDLFDPAGSNQRWSNADLDRAIEQAVERYSRICPLIAYADIAAQPYQRTYAYPVPWNAAYPAWWIERVLYPLQRSGSTRTAPSTAPTAITLSGTALGIGTYLYTVTFITSGGETTPSPTASVTTTLNNQRVQLSALPVAPSVNETTLPVIGRNIYRTAVNGSTFALLATLSDNTTSSYSDNIADAALANRPVPPTVNTSGIMCWPPIERAFSEYASIFTDPRALASSGNMAAQGGTGTTISNTAALSPAFTVHLAESELPQDTTQVMRVFYATSHQLDASSSTLPLAHRDLLVTGACAYALQAYQTPTNDNFAFQDGTLHEHVDDTAIPKAWLTAAWERMQQFETQLQQLKLQQAMSSGLRVHWGDVADQWSRL